MHADAEYGGLCTKIVSRDDPPAHDLCRAAFVDANIGELDMERNEPLAPRNTGLTLLGALGRRHPGRTRRTRRCDKSTARDITSKSFAITASRAEMGARRTTDTLHAVYQESGQ